MDQTLFDAPQPVGPAEAKPIAPIIGGKRWIEVPARDQMSFHARRTDDFVPQDALVRVIEEVIEALDFSEFEDAYPGGGRPAFHPKFIGKLMIYGLCCRIVSARELSRRLERDLHFMWLARETRVNHAVFSTFRGRFRKQLKALFKQTVVLGTALGLVDLRAVAIDGTKVASSARRQALKKDDLEKSIAGLEDYIEKLLAQADAVDEAEQAQFGDLRGDEIPKALASAQARREKLVALLPLVQDEPNKRVSPTDPEAPVQKTQDGKRPGYNAQAAVDSKSGFVVAEEVTTDQNDTQQFEPMVEQTIENTGLIPEIVAADSGYNSAEALEYVAGNPEVNAYIKQQPAGKEGLYGQEDFTYDEETDSFVCPAGCRLVFKGTTQLRTECRVYRAEHTCRYCEGRCRCISGKAHYRKLSVQPHGLQIAAMRRRLHTDEGKQAMQMRSSTVERTFGMIKAQLGLRQLVTRGLNSAKSQFSLAVLAVNVLKLAKHVQVSGWEPAAAF